MNINLNKMSYVFLFFICLGVRSVVASPLRSLFSSPLVHVVVTGSTCGALLITGTVMTIQDHRETKLRHKEIVEINSKR